MSRRTKQYAGMDVPPKVSLEVSAFCTRKCPWCPQHDRPRRQELLPIDLIDKVVRELAAAGFDGSFGFHFFNEPLADKRLEDIVGMTRKVLPKADLYFHTNGDLLTVERFRSLLAAGLDHMTVNHYDDKAGDAYVAFVLGLAPDETSHIKHRFFKKHHIYSRAGLIQTKRPVPLERQCRRIRQMCINYLGDVVLCCNDYLGQVCVGNVRDKGVLELYNDPVLKRYRTELDAGHRAGLKLCDRCDLFG